MGVLVRGGRETERSVSRPPPRESCLCPYGMGGLGNGATPQIAVAHGGSGGVGRRESFPWVDAEKFAVPGAPVVHVPIKVFRLGYGFVKPYPNRNTFMGT